VLALAAARHNDRVGALMFADKVEFVVRPAKGRPHALRVIRDLVAFTPRGRGTNLAEALRYAAKLLRHRAIVVVLSDFRADGWEEPLAQLAARHEIVAITVDDPRELELPDVGWVDFEDAETGQRVLLDTSHTPARGRVRAAAVRQLQERTRRRGRALSGRCLGARGPHRERATHLAPGPRWTRRLAARRHRRLRDRQRHPRHCAAAGAEGGDRPDPLRAAHPAGGGLRRRLVCGPPRGRGPLAST